MKIPVGVPDFNEEEVSQVAKTMASGWIARGKALEEFETKLAQYLGVNYVVTVNSGTAALEVALRALKIKDKEIITTATSCSPTANGILHSGNRPVYIDISPQDFNLNPELIEAKINQNTAAILPVHVYGRPADMDKINEIAKRHNLVVIEDVAQAMGSTYKGKQAGSLGDIGCFSLNINKIITTGEGGFISTNNQQVAEIAKMIRNYGRDPSGSDYCYTHFGHNFKLTNLQASVGLAQLDKIRDLVAARKKNNAYLKNLLQDLDIQLPLDDDSDYSSVCFCFPIVLKPGIRDKLKSFLESKGIEVRTMFRPMCNQPYYREMYGTDIGQYPNAEFVGENGLYIGCYPSLSEEQMKFMADSIREGLNVINY